MKPIVVKDQVRLSAARCLYLTLAGMYYRMTRSAITIVIVALAVAFLSYMLSYSMVVQDLTASAVREFQQNRLLGEWMTRTGHPDPLKTVVGSVVSRDSYKSDEYRRWSGMDEKQFAAVRDACDRYRQFLAAFENMRKASRAVLLGDTDPYALPALLLNPLYFPVFTRQLKELSLQPPLGSETALRQFLDTDWPLISSFYDKVQQGQQAAVDSVHSGLAGRRPLDALLHSPDEIRALTARAGFAMPDGSYARLIAQARVTADQDAILRLLGITEIKAAVAREMSLDQKKLDLAVFTRWISSKGRAKTFCRLAQARVPEGMVVPGPDDVFAVAKAYRRTEELQRAVGDGQAAADGARGLSALPQATKWLIIVSFLVCAVGICNTMFMSVTERFTEIATMKCLGAMDGFVMLLFVFEAVIQGVTGSLCGIILGFFLTVLRGVFGYGGMFFDTIPVNALFMTVGFSLLAGVFLAAVSAVGPAWMAARLAPMEAMRVE